MSSTSPISSLINTIEDTLVSVITGVSSFITAGINELVNYAPTLVDIAVIGAVSVGLAYAFRSVLTDIPFVNSITSALGRIFRF